MPMPYEIDLEGRKKMTRTTFTVNITKPMIQRAIAAVGGENNKLNAIKEIRERYAIGLREAKELVETVILKKREFKRMIEVTRFEVDYVMAASREDARSMSVPQHLFRAEDSLHVSEVTETGF